MDLRLFGSELWQPALDKYAAATGLTVKLFDAEGTHLLTSSHLTPLVLLFEGNDFDPGLFSDCARRLSRRDQTGAPSAACTAKLAGLAVFGAPLVLEGTIVGAAVAGYVMTGFTPLSAAQRWSRASGVPFDRLWSVVRGQAPMPERRLALQGELLQVLGDALLRENYRTRQYEATTVQLRTAAAAKDEFLAVLSHELRTPLAAIAGWTGVLKMSQSQEHLRRGAEAIERNVALQSRMIEDLLDVNRISTGQLSLKSGTHPLQVLVRAALESTAQDVDNKSIRFELDDGDTPLFIDGDSGRLQQVFRNVFSNAVKFTPRGGVIGVAIGRDSDLARIVVTDSGIGIAPQFLPFVFDIFRQQEQGTRREYGGLGIGLSLVKRLVELHGGTVRVESGGAGHGTRVTIELPLAAQIPAMQPGPKASRVPLAALAGLSVLVVEDSEDSRESLRILLQLLGAHVVVAGDGREALDVMAQSDCDLVLCDLRMPRMDGFEFMRELNSRPTRAHPPVVAMSGFVSDADRERTREAGFESHINKPFDEATVVAAVDAAVHRQVPSSLH